MTRYEINYRNRLNEMLTAIIHKYGLEHQITIVFARYVKKYRNVANYENREVMERIFKAYIK